MTECYWLLTGVLTGFAITLLAFFAGLWVFRRLLLVKDEPNSSGFGLFSGRNSNSDIDLDDTTGIKIEEDD